MEEERIMCLAMSGGECHEETYIVHERSVMNTWVTIHPIFIHGVAVTISRKLLLTHHLLPAENVISRIWCPLKLQINHPKPARNQRHKFYTHTPVLKSAN